MKKLVAGGTIGRYRLVRRLGAGAMGEVYLAEDPQIERQLAIKTMLVADDHGHDADNLKRRLLREAKAAGRLVHPHVVTLFDADEDDGLLYLAFEFVPGSDLMRRARVEPPLVVGEILRIVREAAEGLEHAHQQGIVHRDVKPSNILLDARGRVKVADFGIAKMAGQATELTMEGSVVGSPQYLSPEQVRGEELDGQSDVFSLGVVLYELLTRSRPFAGDTLTTIVYQILHKDPPPLEQLWPAVPAPLAAVTARMLAKDRRARFATAAEVVAAIGELERTLPPTFLAAVPLASEDELGGTVVLQGTAPTRIRPATEGPPPGLPPLPVAPGLPPSGASGLPPLPPPPPSPPQAVGYPPPVSAAPPPLPPGYAPPAYTPPAHPPLPPAATSARRGPGLLLALVAVVLVVAMAGGWWLLRTPAPPVAGGDDVAAAADAADGPDGTKTTGDPTSNPAVDESPVGGEPKARDFAPTSSGDDADAGGEDADGGDASDRGGGMSSPPPERPGQDERAPATASGGELWNNTRETATAGSRPAGRTQTGSATGPTAAALTAGAAGDRSARQQPVAPPSVRETPPVQAPVAEPEPEPAPAAPEVVPEPTQPEITFDRELSTGLGLVFDIDPEDAYVLVREVSERRARNIGKARDWNGKEQDDLPARHYGFADPGDYVVTIRHERFGDYVFLIHAERGGPGKTPIKLKLGGGTSGRRGNG